MATFKAHWGKPIWVTSGGAELPVTNAAIATALTLTGPGKFSLDELFGIRLPRWVAIPAVLATTAGVAYGVLSSNRTLQAAQQGAAQGQAQPAVEQATA
jgi:putative oxidoreductase